MKKIITALFSTRPPTNVFRNIVIGLFLGLTLLACSPTVEDHRDTVVHVNAKGSTGTGVFVSPTTILTAKHVISSSAEHIVTMKNGEKRTARVTWTSVESDLALLRVKDYTSADYSKITCRSPKLGEHILTVGMPLNFSLWNVFWGRVSNDKPSSTGLHLTDMTVFPGNSGGPVYGEDGKVLGVVVSMLIGPRGQDGLALFEPSYKLCNDLGIN